MLDAGVHDCLPVCFRGYVIVGHVDGAGPAVWHIRVSLPLGAASSHPPLRSVPIHPLHGVLVVPPTIYTPN